MIRGVFMGSQLTICPILGVPGGIISDKSGDGSDYENLFVTDCVD